MSKFRITASYSHRGHTVDCSSVEILGDAFGAEYTTREEAQEVADDLQRTIADYDHDETTVYSVEEVEDEQRDPIEWECHAGNGEPISDLDPQAGDTVADYACDAWSFRWDVLVERCRAARLVLVFDYYDEEDLCNYWDIRATKGEEEHGSCIGI